MSFYDLLEVEFDVGEKKLRTAYQKKMMSVHPDRHQENKDHYRKLFHQVQTAFETLSDKFRREDYDKKLLKEETVHVHDEVNFDDLEHFENEHFFLYTCRCSQTIKISESALEEGYQIFSCQSCSLNIKLDFKTRVEED